MPRALRIEYPGAIYHVMNRGDRREPIFLDDADHRRFLSTLAQACSKTDWQAHAFCLMRNHFHLVLETPNANLVAGMRWFLSTYAARFNRRHKLFGHLFGGRYKALLVDGERLEQHLETHRAQEDGDEFKPIRRGWCPGSEAFRRELLEGVHTRITESRRMEDNGILNFRCWSLTRRGLVWGFLCGGFLTMVVWRFNVSRWSFVNVVIYDVFRFLWNIMTIPGNVLAELFHWRWDASNAQDFTAGMLMVVASSNAFLSAALGMSIGCFAHNRHRIFVGSKSKSEKYGNVLAAMLLGAVIGILLTLLVFFCSSINGGNGLIAWIVVFLDYVVCAPAKLLAASLGLAWHAMSFADVKLPILCFIAITNGLLLTFFAGLITWLVETLSDKR